MKSLKVEAASQGDVLLERNDYAFGSGFQPIKAQKERVYLGWRWKVSSRALDEDTSLIDG